MKIWSRILGLAILLVASVTSTGKAAFDYRLIATGNFSNYDHLTFSQDQSSMLVVDFSTALMPVTLIGDAANDYGLAVGETLNLAAVQGSIPLLAVEPGEFSHSNLVTFNTMSGAFSFSSTLGFGYYNLTPEINSQALFSMVFYGTLASVSSSTEAALVIFVAGENALGTDPAWALIIPPSTAVPEPSTLAIMGLGVFGLAFHARRRRLAAQS
jgi:hypothetical protein